MKLEIAQEIEILPLLKHTSVCRNLETDSLKLIAAHSVIVEFKKKNVIWSQGEPARFFCIVIEGAVEVRKVVSNGEVSTLAIFVPGDPLGISALLKKINFPASARGASTRGVVLKIYLDGLPKTTSIELSHSIQVWLRDMLLKHESILREKIDLLSTRKISDRIELFLWKILSRYDRTALIDGVFEIPISLSKTQIAQSIDVRIESAIRTLNLWEAKGKIKFGSDSIQIDKSMFGGMQR